MQHRGEIVEKAVRQSGLPLTRLTKQLGKSRRWIYHAFENPALSIDTVLEIGKIIHYDFSDEIDELKRYAAVLHDSSRPQYYPNEENSVEYWKNKYLHLLEKYNALLEG
jgi:predicted transcriptional regulator